MEFRWEREDEYYSVENLTREAFWDVYRPGCNEHLLLHKLRKEASFIPELDYVVVEDGKIVANIVYCKMFSDTTKEMCEEIIGFGPISVLPEYQKMGFGKALINFTMNKAKELGYKAVLIEGSDRYYPRFGFEPASRYQIYLPGMEGEEAPFFMAKELEEGYLKNHGGVYEFNPCYVVNEKELEEFELHFPKKMKRKPGEYDLK